MIGGAAGAGPGVVARRDAIVADLRRLVGPQRRDRRRGRPARLRDRRADRLSPHAAGGRAAGLDRGGLARCCATATSNGIKVVARGAGTSLSGGALPAEDAVVIGVSRMNRVLEIDYVNRIARVEAGITNLGISEAVKAHGFFYAPDPSSQLACTLAGNIAMNSGGAHCLKYGVTTNNVLGLKMVLMDGEVVDIGGAHLDAPGYDLLGLVVGSEGQFGIVTEATVRILRAAEGARPMLLGFDSSEAAGQCVSAIIGAGIIPVAIEFMDKPAIHVCEAFAKAGYPLDVEALLIIEVEGSDDEIADLLGRIGEHRQAVRAQGAAHQPERGAERRHLEGPQVGVRRHRPHLRLLLHGRHHPARQAGRGAGRHLRTSATSTACKVANIFHAGDGNLHPLILYDANDADAGRAGRAGGRRDPGAVRGLRRLPHRRARRRHREARPDARAVHRDRSRAADADQDRVRSASGC